MRSGLLILIVLVETVLIALILYGWVVGYCLDLRDADEATCTEPLVDELAFGAYGLLAAAWAVSIWGLFSVRRRFRRALLTHVIIVVIAFVYLAYVTPIVINHLN